MDDTFKTQKRPQEREIDIELLKRKRAILRRTRAIKNNFKFLSLVISLALIIYLFFFSSAFSIQKIEINNLKYLDENEISSEFEFLYGRNFFLTDLSSLRQNLLKNHPFLSAIYTEKHFPKTINITIVEKEPFLIARTSSTGCYLLDKEAYVLSKENQSCDFLNEQYIAPEISGVDIDATAFEYEAQSNLYSTRKMYDITNVLEYYGYSIKSFKLEKQILDVELMNEKHILFLMTDDIDVQLKRFLILQPNVKNEKIEFEIMDLRFERPVLM